jgi:fumarate reductase iron-sulfur subunit
MKRKVEVKTDSFEENSRGGIAIVDMHSVPLIVRREIEALIAAPLIKAFSEEFGKEETLKVAEKVVKNLARDTGKLLSQIAGGDSLEHLKNALPLFGQGGMLEFHIVEDSPARVAMNVNRCKYAEMYAEHGLQEYGYLLSCGRDFALIDGFNPRIRLERTKTIMEGADCCDFCFLFDEE